MVKKKGGKAGIPPNSRKAGKGEGGSAEVEKNSRFTQFFLYSKILTLFKNEKSRVWGNTSRDVWMCGWMIGWMWGGEGEKQKG